MDVIERLQTAAGEAVLRRRGDDYEIIIDGTFLMATHGGRSERAMVDLALAGLAPPRRVLVGGLGVGYTLAACLQHPAVAAVTVVERETAVVRWNRLYFSRHNGNALADPRVSVVEADLADYLAGRPLPWDAILLDVDNGPGWLVSPGNARLYAEAGLRRLRRWLAPGGVLAVWAAQPEPAFSRRLAAAIGPVRAHAIPVGRGGDDYVYLAQVP